MDTETTTETLTLILNTLNRIEVSGRDNLTRLLGCIRELEKMKEARQHDAHDQPRQDV